MNHEITVQFSIPFTHRLIFTEDIFSPQNLTLIDSLGQSQKIILFIDSGLLNKQPDLGQKIEKYFSQFPQIRQLVPMVVIPGGEQAKRDPQLFQMMIEKIKQAEICRHSYVITIGGGAVLDAVCFAASIVHRGVRQIRIPTTVLAQNDAGIGIKNGIDAFDSKNFLGTFSPPDLVINDPQFLKTLPDNEWRNGTAEAIKVALIKDASFFNWIADNAKKIAARDQTMMQKLIQDCATLHLNHIAHAGDPFEKGSARPLDFGHWSAHKIEQLSQFEVGHGHAVAIGIAHDTMYSYLKNWISQSEAKKIIRCLLDMGFTLTHPCLYETNSTNGELKIIEGLREFQEHIGGELNITMLKGIGRGFQVNELDIELIQKLMSPDMDLQTNLTC